MRYFFFILLGALLIILDGISKFLADAYLENQLILIPNFLSLEYYQNPGIAFSFPLTGIALKIITCILIFGIIWYYMTQEKQKKSSILDTAYTLILAGAL
jgi:lipoprotein signal peptidase